MAVSWVSKIPMLGGGEKSGENTNSNSTYGWSSILRINYALFGLKNEKTLVPIMPKTRLNQTDDLP